MRNKILFFIFLILVLALAACTTDGPSPLAFSAGESEPAEVAEVAEEEVDASDVIVQANQAIEDANERMATAEAIINAPSPTPEVVEVTRVVTETVVETVVEEVPVEIVATKVVTVEVQPEIDYTKVMTASVPNACAVVNTTQEDIDGVIVATDRGGYVEVGALGLRDCAWAFEGRMCWDFPLDNTHEIVGAFGAAEEKCLAEGSQWIMPPATEPRDILWGLAVGKCANWIDAGVSPLPIEFIYIDLEAEKVTRLPATCGDVLEFEDGNLVIDENDEPIVLDNILPEEIGLLPHEALPGLPGETTTTGSLSVTSRGTFDGVSSFTSENRGMQCRSVENPLMGDNMTTLNPSWDEQCIYLLDGTIDGERAIGLVRGEDLETASATFDASVWAVPAGWVATSWARDFARDNCPSELPILLYEDGAWVEHEVYECP